MIRIRFIRSDGQAQDVVGQPGLSVMEVAVANDVAGIEAACGGAMACCTCLVHVPEPWRERLSPPSAAEQDLMSAHTHVRPESRLSCQLRVEESLDGIELELPPEQQ